MAEDVLAGITLPRPIALWLSVVDVSDGAFGEAWSINLSSSGKLSSVPGFKTGRGGSGLAAGGGVAINIRWVGAGIGGGGATAVDTG
jgi:hypothetical protein